VFLSVWVEKDALAEIIQRAAEGVGAGFMACRGYPSVSALSEFLAQAHRVVDLGDHSDLIVRSWDHAGVSMRHAEQGVAKKAVVLYLGDHDPDGLEIPLAAERGLLRLQIVRLAETYGADFEPLQRAKAALKDKDFAEARKIAELLGAIPIRFERIALTHAQIQQHNPPPFDAKETSARFQAYVAATGLTDAWELDALDPRELRRIVLNACAAYPPAMSPEEEAEKKRIAAVRLYDELAPLAAEHAADRDYQEE
jgi:hypothetical protein